TLATRRQPALQRLLATAVPLPVLPRGHPRHALHAAEGSGRSHGGATGQQDLRTSHRDAGRGLRNPAAVQPQARRLQPAAQGGLGGGAPPGARAARLPHPESRALRASRGRGLHAAPQDAAEQPPRVPDRAADRRCRHRSLGPSRDALRRRVRAARRRLSCGAAARLAYTRGDGEKTGEEMPYQHLLIAVDLTEASDRIASHAHELARIFGARLSLVHVVEYVPVDPAGEALLPPPVNMEEELMEAARKRLDALCDKLGLPECRRHVVLGNIKTEVVRIAAEEECDLIVLGRHERHGLQLLLGSTEKSVLASAPCHGLAVRL